MGNVAWATTALDALVAQDAEALSLLETRAGLSVIPIFAGHDGSHRVAQDGHFDVVLVDYDLDDGKGSAVVEALAASAYDGRIVAVSSHDHGNQALLAAGAHDVCSKMNFAEIERHLSPPGARAAVPNEPPSPPAGQPYTRAEVERAAVTGTLPERGAWCPACQNYIPQFADLTGEQVAELRRLRETPGRVLESYRRLRETTGCSLVWAKIWMMHPQGPNSPPKRTHLEPLVEEDIRDCPRCGHSLGRGATRCWQAGCGFALPQGRFARGHR